MHFSFTPNIFRLSQRMLLHDILKHAWRAYSSNEWQHFCRNRASENIHTYGRLEQGQGAVPHHVDQGKRKIIPGNASFRRARMVRPPAELAGVRKREDRHAREVLGLSCAENWGRFPRLIGPEERNHVLRRRLKEKSIRQILLQECEYRKKGIASAGSILWVIYVFLSFMGSVDSAGQSTERWRVLLFYEHATRFKGSFGREKRVCRVMVSRYDGLLSLEKIGCACFLLKLSNSAIRDWVSHIRKISLCTIHT